MYSTSKICLLLLLLAINEEESWKDTVSDGITVMDFPRSRFYNFFFICGQLGKFDGPAFGVVDRNTKLRIEAKFPDGAHAEN